MDPIRKPDGFVASAPTTATDAKKTGLKPNQRAVIIGVQKKNSPTSITNNPHFDVMIGNVAYYKSKEEAFKNAKDGDSLVNLNATDKNKGWLDISDSALPKEQSVEIELLPNNKVKLSLFGMDKFKPLKESTIDAKNIQTMDMGFDLKINQDNKGKTLSPRLTEYLYNFATSP